MKKNCSKCGKIKNINDFYTKGKLVNGDKRISSICKICDNSKNKKYVKDNKEKVNETQRKLYQKNKGTVKDTRKEYRYNRKEDKKEYDRKRYLLKV